jgi:hypothetical protein
MTAKNDKMNLYVIYKLIDISSFKIGQGKPPMFGDYEGYNYNLKKRKSYLFRVQLLFDLFF